MVTIQIPEELYYNGFFTLFWPLFEKLGLKSYILYLHVVYVYVFAIVAVLAVVAVVLIRKIRQKQKTSTTRIEEPVQSAQESKTVESSEPRILAAVYQHIGTREDQQDSYGVSEPGDYSEKGLIAVVADGMGGLANGRMVSSALVRSFISGFTKSDPRQNSADFLLEQAMIANAGVNQMLQGQQSSGSTLISCVIRNGYLHFLTVGDSRLYLYRGGAMIQLNREHIYQEELAVKAVNQLNSLQQVRGDRQAQALTSFFGIGRMPYVDRNDEGILLVDGDKLLLASDGVFGTLSRGQMSDALAKDVSTAAKSLGEMIRAANRKHQDNNTAVVLEYRI